MQAAFRAGRAGLSTGCRTVAGDRGGLPEVGRKRGGKKQGSDPFAAGIGRGSTGAGAFVERFDLSRSGSGSGGAGR